MKPLKSPLRERASCDTCEFAEMHENDDHQFYCRRHAPKLVNGGMGAIFPVVGEDDWCGDYREELTGAE